MDAEKNNEVSGDFPMAGVLTTWTGGTTDALKRYFVSALA
jgi:hypothetical protein